jgi:putative addiction module component (TIGR02574 family)
MADQVARLVQLGKKLAPEERSRLVAELLESLHEGELVEVEAAWDAEVERRLAAFDRGEVTALEGEAVLAKTRRLAYGQL